MKKYIIFFLFTISWHSGYTQTSIHINDYWDNTYYINPSSINSSYAGVISMAARKQWIHFPGAPTTFFASGLLYLDPMHTQFGVKAFSDNIGYTTTANIALSYAYAVILNDDWRLHLGVAASFESLSYDPSQVRVDTQSDPFIYQKLVRVNHYNADLGTELASKALRFGASSQNIFALFFPKRDLQTNINYLYVIYRDYTEQLLDFGIGACGIQIQNQRQLELNFTTFFKTDDQSDLFQLGAFYRSSSEMGFIAGINLSKSLFLSYSYDYSVGGINRSSIGSHELMIIYRFFRAQECHGCY